MKLSMTKVFVTALAVMLLLPFSWASAGLAVGEWQTHSSYHDATVSVKAFGKIYILSAGSLYSYDPEDNAVYTYNKILGLSDYDISQIAFCEKENALILAYSNGNLDILYSDETLYNFTDIKNYSAADKRVFSINIIDNYAYISTALGLVKFDIKRKEISNTYKFENPVYSSVILGNEIICATGGGVYNGNLTDNLLDFSKWVLFESHSFSHLYILNNRIVGNAVDKNVWFIDNNTAKLTEIKKGISSISFTDNKLILGKDSILYVYTDSAQYSEYNVSDITVKNVMYDGKSYWTSCGNNGLGCFQIVDNKSVWKMYGLLPNSPRRNYCHYMNFLSPEKLIVVGGCQNYNAITYEGTVMLYQNEKWSYLDDDIPSKTGLKYIDITVAVEDPNENNHYYVGSARQGLYEFKNGLFYKLHTFDNSGLTNILQVDKYNYVSVNALQYDNSGNLWMANNEVDTIIKVMEPNGNWFGLYYPEIKGLPTFTQIKFDSEGRLWTNSSRWKAGLFCADLKGTLKNDKDDIHKFIGPEITNQDGITETINWLYFFEFDLDGKMWLGTDKGIFVLDNPNSFLSDNKVIFKRIKIPRNDGTNQADYLLNSVYTTAICIDKSNRKWIGTQNNGVFLVSADGIETIEHFTTENSPLPSNEIQSITIDHSSGSVFFGTSLGLIEYGGDANRPQNNLLESKIWAYPNPVLPNYDGLVSITGLTENSNVKIVSPSGKLVNQGISKGGLYTWNCCDFSGRRVSSGVYQVIITDNENEEGFTTNVTIIK